MPTWNTSKPATANSVAADVADIEENFDFLEDLLTYFFKTWSTSSAAIGKNSIYYVNPGATDQGADDNARSAKDLIDSTGADKNAILYFPHFAVDGNSTTFTFGTAETAYDNHTLIFENGSIIAGAGAFTIQGTAIALGDLTISGEVVVAAGARLITFGTLTVSGTLTISAGGQHVELGSTTVSGTYTLSGERKAHSTLDVSYASVATSSTDKTTLYTYTIPANTLKLGEALRVKCCGVYTGNGSSAASLFFALASAEEQISLAVPIGGTFYFCLDIEIIPYDASNAYCNYSIAYSGASRFEQEDLAFDITSAVAFTVSGQVTGATSITKKTTTMEIF